MSDDTVAGTTPGAGDAETEIVPLPTTEAPELAWSREAEETEVFSRSWGAAAERASVIVLTAAAVAALVAGAVWLGLRVYDATRPVAAPSAAAPSVVPAAALPPPIAASVPPSANPSGAPSSSSPTLDPARPRPLQYDSRGVPIIPKNPSAAELQQALVAIFDRDGIPYGSPTAASADADSVCEYLDSGHRSFADLVAWIRRARPSLMSDQVGGFAGASIGVYCPRYGYLIDSTNEGATS